MEKQDFRPLKLDRDNYVVWKWQFVNVAKAQKMSRLFEQGAVSEELDDKGLALLGSALSEENMLKIINCTNFRQAWNTIQLCFEN